MTICLTWQLTWSSATHAPSKTGVGWFLLFVQYKRQPHFILARSPTIGIGYIAYWLLMTDRHAIPILSFGHRKPHTIRKTKGGFSYVRENLAMSVFLYAFWRYLLGWTDKKCYGTHNLRATHMRLCALNHCWVVMSYFMFAANLREWLD